MKRRINIASARALGMLHGPPVPSVAAVDARPEAGEWIVHRPRRADVVSAFNEQHGQALVPPDEENDK